MDLLYSKYASPMELINTYIDQGRFGEFVFNFLRIEEERKQAERKKEDEQHLWMMYVHSWSDKSFEDWKSEALQSTKEPKKGKDEDLTDSDIEGIIDDLFPGR